MIRGSNRARDRVAGPPRSVGGKAGPEAPRAGHLTVTSVEVTPDLSHARVYVTHLAGREHAAEALAGLRHAAGFLRSQLGARLSVYSVPALVVQPPAAS